MATKLDEWLDWNDPTLLKLPSDFELAKTAGNIIALSDRLEMAKSNIGDDNDYIVKMLSEELEREKERRELIKRIQSMQELYKWLGPTFLDGNPLKRTMNTLKDLFDEFDANRKRP